MNKKIGFIGTGLMGSGMARSLIRKGHSVRIYNRTRAKAEEVANLGGEVAATPAEAARDADVVVTMLADPAALLGVMEGPDGVLSTIKRGAVLIDSSTVSPPTTLRVLELLKTKGADMLDAPVFGSKNEAEKGELGFIVGGEKEVLARVQDVLDCMGRTNHIGGNGLGAHAKLVVNLVIAGTLQAFNESMVLATKAGLDPDAMLKIILSSRARSGIIEMKAPQVLKRDFSPFFPLQLMAKDMRLVLEAAASLGVKLPFATSLSGIYESCLSDGLGPEDFCATIKPLEKQAALEVKGATPSA
jgi:3-hydroxyisobutyrate dehydrogenase-like beta-hydroxyacid dehydrogenase